MKLMSPKAFYYTVGKKNFFQYILFGIFVLFFYLPLMNLCMLAFADKYEVPAIIPQKFGFRWWEFVLGQGSLLSSIATSCAGGHCDSSVPADLHSCGLRPGPV